MDKTPISKRKPCLRENSHVSISSIDEESPSYFPNTQEANEDIDVLWDWNSPQASEKRYHRRKRLLVSNSPKVPIKRHPSNSQMPNFEKLRGELEALKKQLAMPDETCLCVSPVQEEEINKCQQFEFNDVEDFFNDAVDEQLALFSQKIENEITRQNENDNNKNNNNNSMNLDDSLDDILGAIKDDDIELLTITQMTKPDIVNIEKIEQKKPIIEINRNLSKVEIFRTKSFENDGNGKIETKLNRTKSFETDKPKAISDEALSEIEKNRKLALAKLEAKKSLAAKKCSMEEIEQKRLQALAKLEAKRMQEVMEKNRQEALKRLEQSRIKNVSLVKSSLVKRL